MWDGGCVSVGQCVMVCVCVGRWESPLFSDLETHQNLTSINFGKQI